MNLAADIPMELRDMLKTLTNTKKLLKKRLRAASDAGAKAITVDEQTKLDMSISQLTTDITKLSSSMAILTRELRSWEGKVRKSVELMTNEQRIAVVVRFLEELPPGERVMFRDANLASNTLKDLWNLPG